MQNPLTLYCPLAYPPPILSHPMGALPLFYPPTPCMPSPYSISLQPCPPPILSQPMHTLPLFYPSPCIFHPSSCMPSPYSIPACACPPFILYHPMHAILQREGMFLLWHLSMHIWICSHCLYHHYLPSLVIWSINLGHQVLNVCCCHSHELTTWTTH